MIELLERLQYHIQKIQEKESYDYIKRGNQNIEIATDPSSREFDSMLKESRYGLRMSLDESTGEIIVWDAEEITHYELAELPGYKNLMNKGEGIVLDKARYYWIESGIAEDLLVYIEAMLVEKKWLENSSGFTSHVTKNYKRYISNWYKLLTIAE